MPRPEIGEIPTERQEVPIPPGIEKGKQPPLRRPGGETPGQGWRRNYDDPTDDRSPIPECLGFSSAVAGVLDN